MGSLIELNDTLQLTGEQGFPIELLDFKKHHKKAITTADLEGKIFEFRHKSSARLFHLDPIRVYFAQNINGKWLFWGKALIQSLHIEKKLDKDGNWEEGQWVTSGTYTISEVYTPEYQKAFTLREAPPNRCFFK